MSNSRKPLTPGYENEEGPHHQHDAEGNLIVDFSGANESAAEFSKAARTASSRQIDPATGYSKDMVWTTKDHRRIPIPHMQDSHLLNVIAFLRRNVEPVYKKQILKQILLKVIKLSVNTFEMGFLDHEDNYMSKLAQAKDNAVEIGQRVLAMDTDTFLHEFHPQWSNLYQEAYKRKLLIEVDPSKLSGGQ